MREASKLIDWMETAGESSNVGQELSACEKQTEKQQIDKREARVIAIERR